MHVVYNSSSKFLFNPLQLASGSSQAIGFRQGSQSSPRCKPMAHFPISSYLIDHSAAFTTLDHCLPVSSLSLLDFWDTKLSLFSRTIRASHSLSGSSSLSKSHNVRLPQAQSLVFPHSLSSLTPSVILVILCFSSIYLYANNSQMFISILPLSPQTQIHITKFLFGKHTWLGVIIDITVHRNFLKYIQYD